MLENHPPITAKNIQQLSELLVIEHSGTSRLAWSPNSKMLAVGDWANMDWSLPESLRPTEKPTSVWLFAIDSPDFLNKPLRQFEGNQSTICGLAFSPDGSMLVSSATDGTVRFWDIDTGKQVSIVRVPGYNIQNMQFSPDGTHIAAAGSEEEG